MNPVLPRLTQPFTALFPFWFRCPGCAQSPDTETFPICQDCHASLVDCPSLHTSAPPHSADRASLHFNRYLAVGRGYELLKAWKRKGGPAWSDQILRWPAELQRQIRGREIDRIVPIPHRWQRIRQLGRSPTLEIAQSLGRALELPCSLHLLPHRRTPQRSLDLADRRTRPMSFSLDPAADLRGRAVLLVDDFVTTGHTLRAAAQALRHAGAWRVDTFSLAQRPRLSEAAEPRVPAGAGEVRDRSRI